MARIEVKASAVNAHVASVWVEIKNITDAQVKKIKTTLRNEIKNTRSIYDAIASTYLFSVKLAPQANPSDIWHHVIYREMLNLGYNSQQWARNSGRALEVFLCKFYKERLKSLNLRMRQLTKQESDTIFEALRFRKRIQNSKVDCIIEKKLQGNKWDLVAGVHVKASIAERIQNDVPVSLALIDAGILSLVLTLDCKSFPPPHGDGINYGELGGRSWGERQGDRRKREYIETDGHFDALFSFNLRTPPSDKACAKKIYTLGFDKNPDAFMQFLIEKLRLR